MMECTTYAHRVGARLDRLPQVAGGHRRVEHPLELETPGVEDPRVEGHVVHDQLGALTAGHFTRAHQKLARGQ